MTPVLIRPATDDDATGIATLVRKNARYYAGLAPDVFRVPDEQGLAQFLLSDRDWRVLPTSLALVADVDGQVAGYLEASLIEPSATARWQGEADLSRKRLFIGFVGTDDAFRRQGVATKLVKSAEDWGRERGAVLATCDTWIDSPLSMPFWERRMGYQRKNVIFRKPLD